MRPTGPDMPPLGGSGGQWIPKSLATSSQQPPLSSSQPPSLNPEELNATLLKLEELQCYMPLIARMIDRLQSVGDPEKTDQLTKLTSLYNVLKTKNTK